MDRSNNGASPRTSAWWCSNLRHLVSANKGRNAGEENSIKEDLIELKDRIRFKTELKIAPYKLSEGRQ